MWSKLNLYIPRSNPRCATHVIPSEERIEGSISTRELPGFLCCFVKNLAYPLRSNRLSHFYQIFRDIGITFQKKSMKNEEHFPQFLHP